jgi:hypothetical protein
MVERTLIANGGKMKITHAIAIGALGSISFAALAQQGQQQSAFQTPAVVAESTTTTTPVGSPLLLNLTGVTATDQSGQPVGGIQHILLNPSGCVDLAVLSLGGQKLVPVPWALVSGTGALRGQTEVAGRAALALKVDRATLQQAPSITVNQVPQLTQPQVGQQVVQQVYAFFAQQQQTSVGGTTSQTNVVGGAAGTTNRPGTGTTNQTNILSPTGPTNARPGQPPFNRPPTNRPPATTPGQPVQPAQPAQPGQPIQ